MTTQNHGVGLAGRTPHMSYTFAIADLPHVRPGAAALRPNFDRLIRSLNRFDGWAVTIRADNVPRMVGATDIVAWSRRERVQLGAKAVRGEELVAIKRPDGRQALDGALRSIRTNDVVMSDFVLRPAWWTRWVTAHLGYQAGVDSLQVTVGSMDLLSPCDGMLQFELEAA